MSRQTTVWRHDPAALRAFLTEHQLTGAQAGALIGVGDRTIRRWTGGERQMPYAAWFTLTTRVAEMERDRGGPPVEYFADTAPKGALIGSLNPQPPS